MAFFIFCRQQNRCDSLFCDESDGRAFEKKYKTGHFPYFWFAQTGCLVKGFSRRRDVAAEIATGSQSQD
jgi:hypothetical protein